MGEILRKIFQIGLKVKRYTIKIILVLIKYNHNLHTQKIMVPHPALKI